MGKKVVGIIEEVRLIGEKEKSVYALFDTGARQTSVDMELAGSLGLGPIIRTARIKNPSVKSSFTRPVVRAIIEIKGCKFDTEVNLQDRSHMSFPVIVGRNVLAKHFIVDPEINNDLFMKKGDE